jgi:hypothetical protein
MVIVRLAFALNCGYRIGLALLEEAKIPAAAR